MHKNSERLIIAAGMALFGAGLLLPWWPLSLLGVLTFALMGQWFIALMCALFLDLVFGIPTSALRYTLFPFSLATLALVLVRALLTRHVRDRSVYW